MIWIAALSVLMFIGSIALIWCIIVWLPPDYLVAEHSIVRRRFADQPLLLGALIFAKNAVGVILVVAGIIMLVTPGQGLLSMLIGVSMLDVPGKQEAINYLLGRGQVIKAINRIRARAGRPRLEMPPSQTASPECTEAPRE